jgi:hypothetical protein
MQMLAFFVVKSNYLPKLIDVEEIVQLPLSCIHAPHNNDKLKLPFQCGIERFLPRIARSQSKESLRQ